MGHEVAVGGGDHGNGRDSLHGQMQSVQHDGEEAVRDGPKVGYTFPAQRQTDYEERPSTVQNQG